MTKWFQVTYSFSGLTDLVDEFQPHQEQEARARFAELKSQGAVRVSLHYKQSDTLLEYTKPNAQ